MSMNLRYELRCRECGKAWGNQPRSICDDCFSPLEVSYDYDAVRAEFTREKIAQRPPNMWRYSSLLPLPQDFRPTLPVGFTPLIKAPRLARQLAARDAALVAAAFSQRFPSMTITGYKGSGWTTRQANGYYQYGANGTLSNVSSSDGGLTWTATFTPNIGVSDLTNLIVLNNTGITDLAASLGLNPALKVAFRGGAITGMLVVGLGLLGVGGYFGIPMLNGDSDLQATKALVGLAFSIFGMVLGSLLPLPAPRAHLVPPPRRAHRHLVTRQMCASASAPSATDTAATA